MIHGWRSRRELTNNGSTAHRRSLAASASGARRATAPLRLDAGFFSARAAAASARAGSSIWRWASRLGQLPLLLDQVELVSLTLQTVCPCQLVPVRLRRLLAAVADQNFCQQAACCSAKRRSASLRNWVACSRKASLGFTAGLVGVLGKGAPTIVATRIIIRRARHLRLDASAADRCPARVRLESDDGWRLQSMAEVEQIRPDIAVDAGVEITQTRGLSRSSRFCSITTAR